MSTSSPAATGTRLPSLTGARAGAAGLVVLHHLVPVLLPLPGLAALARTGYVGVGFFFALSGFVVAWSGGAGQQPAGFLVRRLARVWPLHAVLLLLAVPLAIAEGAPHTLPLLLACLLLVQAWSPDPAVHYGLNGPSWSLSAELSYYLLTPLLLRLPRPVRTVRACVRVLAATACAQVAVVLAAPHATWAPYVLPLAGLPLYVCGGWLGRAQRAGVLPRVPLRTAGFVAAGSLLGAALVASAAAHAGLQDPAGRGLPLALTAPACLLLVVALAQQDLAGARSRLRSRTWVRLGEWSFALYLVHQLVLRLVQLLVPAPGRALGAVLAGLVVLASVLAAALLHRCVEAPAVAAVAAVQRRLAGRTRTPAQTAVRSTASDTTVPAVRPGARCSLQ